MRVFSTDHKVIGHLAWPAQPAPLIGPWLGSANTASENSWRATMLEWTTSSTPPAHNFAGVPIVRRGPYDYSAPGAVDDFLPPSQP